MRDGTPLVVTFGAGTDSTAELCGFKEKGIKPDLILFADTLGEKPETYKHLAIMQTLVYEWWGLEIHIVHSYRKGDLLSLEQDCLNKGMLPSLAYGHRSCSQRFKHQPMDKFVRKWAKDNNIKKIIKAIGFDASEKHRADRAPTEKVFSKNLTEVYWYPLIEWGWRREECIDAIKRNSICLPGKSACFFCPATKAREVIKLKEDHPELIERALAMESLAQKKHRLLIGLGGSNNLWDKWIKYDEAQLKLMLDIEPVHLPCGCSDGD